MQEGRSVCEVLAGTVSPMTSSAGCLGAKSHEVWKSSTTGSSGLGKFSLPTPAPVFVLRDNTMLAVAVGIDTDSLTFAKWELIHFVNVLFWTPSCSSGNHSLQRHFHTKHRKTNNGQSFHCLLSSETIWSTLVIYF